MEDGGRARLVLVQVVLFVELPVLISSRYIDSNGSQKVGKIIIFKECVDYVGTCVRSCIACGLVRCRKRL